MSVVEIPLFDLRAGTGQVEIPWAEVTPTSVYVSPSPCSDMCLTGCTSSGRASTRTWSATAPGEDEGAVQEFLEFVYTSMDVVRIECTALKDPGDWPKIAEFRVESRNDDGGTETVYWSVQKARV